MLESALDEFLKHFSDFQNQTSIAVAVSGGPDSMALAHSIIQKFPDKSVHILSVDHGLRDEAKDEIKFVANWAAQYSNASHHDFVWQGDKPETGIMQEARTARYKLMADFCAQESISYLFLGHHQDDQKETFFIRLSKGSGVDGLAAMRMLSDYNQTLKLARPLLSVSKKEIIDYCVANGIQYVQDPSNKNDHYLRPRLRQVEAALEEEGLTASRIYKITQRMKRASDALEHLSLKAVEDCAQKLPDDALEVNTERFILLPEEIQIRVLLKIIAGLQPRDDYGVRLEKVEELHKAIVEHIQSGEEMKQRSLGYCLFAIDTKNQALLIKKEFSKT